MAAWLPPWWRFDYGDESEFKWAERFAWLPYWSAESGKLIWLKKYWYGWRWITGPGEPVKIERWLTQDEYTWLCLSNQ